MRQNVRIQNKLKTIPSKNRSYSEKQLTKVAIYFGFIIIILLIGIASWQIVDRFGNSLSMIDQLGFLALSYFCLWIFIKTIFDDTIWDVIVNNIKGKKGKDLIAKCLSESFDDSYTYLRNVSLPDHKIGDIDGLLINSKEIVIIEVKYYTGKYIIKDGTFHILKGSYPSPFGLTHDPIKQAERQKSALTEYLNQKSFHPHIRAFVVLAHGKVVGIDGPTTFYVLNKDNLIPKLKEEFASTVHLPDQSVEEIVEVLQ
jgi:hypothetical protein